MNLEMRQTLMQEEIDALCALVNASEKRLDALYEAFLRHTHNSGLEVEDAVKANCEAQESARHGG